MKKISKSPELEIAKNAIAPKTAETLLNVATAEKQWKTFTTAQTWSAVGYIVALIGGAFLTGYSIYKLNQLFGKRRIAI